MNDLTLEERQRLLDALSRLAHGEWDRRQRIVTFLPLTAHRLALRQENILIRGTRGAGKTALFQVVEHLRTSDPLRRLFTDDRIPDALWLDGFSEAMHHPHVSVVDSFAAKASEMALRAFWMGHLLRRLHAELKDAPEPPEFLRPVEGELEPNAWMAQAEGHLPALAAALDQAERFLGQRGQTVFVAYDNLDRLGALDRGVRRRTTGALLALWLSLSSRYRRLRAKIFLREDLLEGAAEHFPDASKLRAVDLEWDVASLFRAAVRHMANTSDDLRAWLLDVPGIALTDWGEFGWMPGELKDEVQRALVARLAGSIMGTGPTKTHTLRWIVNRLRDGQGEIVPRALLGLLGYAAEEGQKNRTKLRGRRLLGARDLEEGLARIAKQRLKEMREDWPVVCRVDNLVGETLPIGRKDAEEKLGRPAPGEQAGLPMDGELVVEELLGLGVLSGRTDGLLDMPDIYRLPQGIRRESPAIMGTEAPAEMYCREGDAFLDQARETDGAEADALFSRALENYQAALNDDREHAEALIGWAVVLRSQAHNKAGVEAQHLREEAIKRFDEVSITNPGSSEARTWKALTLLDMASHMRAPEAAPLRAQVMEMMRGAPFEGNKDWQALMVSGIAFEDHGESLRGAEATPWFVQAEDRYRTAVEIDATSDWGLGEWAGLLLRRSERTTDGEAQALLAQAIEKIQAALLRTPVSPDSFEQWGDALASQSARVSGLEALLLLGQADEKYRVVVHLSPSDRGGHVAMGRLGLRMATLLPESGAEQVVARAIQNFQSALNINPNAHEAFAGIGDLALYQAEQQQDHMAARHPLDHAKQMYQAALYLEPSSVPALLGMGHLLLGEGRRADQPAALWTEAERCFHHAEEYRPGSGAYGLARLAALRGQEETCQAELVRAREYGQFPPRTRFETDPALAAFRDRPWFKQIPF